MTNLIAHKNAVFQKLPLTAGSSFIVKRYESPYFETPWHFHEEYELVFCERGFGKKFIGNSFSDYQEGEIAFIGKNIPHLFKADDSFYQAYAQQKPSSIVIQFSEDFLGKDFFNSPEMVTMKKILVLSKNGLLVLGKTHEHIRQIMIEMLEINNIGRLYKLFEIFMLLSNCDELQPISPSIISGININDSVKMNSVLDYTLQHFREDISIAQVAALSHLSASAFCRYFKSRTQKTFLGFVIEMRLNESRRLLRETNLSILEICYECGFKNLSNFNRLFRKQFQQNPMEFRRNQGL
ncbi:AraC family transcriptional regulator [Flectobacillus major]|uniref:AraC family transcriptional regulator n=1 Tax=Flectobacillus major TaxID=103 RepID=UPI0004171D6C|nr:AraC family transcriptional regulator [Flectobacillus major]